MFLYIYITRAFYSPCISLYFGLCPSIYISFFYLPLVKVDECPLNLDLL